jgi:prepilin-type processing-associated H-X9-DG protein
MWFTAIDQFLVLRPYADRGAGGPGQYRTYMEYKQCPVWDTFTGEVNGGNNPNSGNGESWKEFARTYKMNTHLRHHHKPRQAKVGTVRNASEFVMLGDATSLDQAGESEDVWESGQFSFEVNDPTQAGPALRHNKGANILFVDGHVNLERCPTIKKNLRAPLNRIQIDTWESEFVNAAGTPTDIPNNQKSPAEQGLSRNPRMPLIWSDPALLYRP